MRQLVGLVLAGSDPQVLNCGEFKRSDSKLSDYDLSDSGLQEPCVHRQSCAELTDRPAGRAIIDL